MDPSWSSEPADYYRGSWRLCDAFMDCFGKTQWLVSARQWKIDKGIQWDVLASLWTDNGQVSSHEKDRIRSILARHYPKRNPEFHTAISETLISWLETPALFPIGTTWNYESNVEKMASTMQSHPLSLGRLQRILAGTGFVEESFILRLSKITQKGQYLMLTKPSRYRYGPSKRYGFIGLVPNDTVAGDLVCRLEGCSEHVVLRKAKRPKGSGVRVQDSITKYEVIGEAFVQLVGFHADDLDGHRMRIFHLV